jgi:ABC-type molybdate transport system substrate-binding protein
MKTQSKKIAAALCLALCAAPALAQSCAPGTPQLIIYHAGSLTAAFSQVEKAYAQQSGVCVVDAAAGSVDAARQVTTGGKPADIYASADAEDIDVLLKPHGFAKYNIRFAEGAMVLAYTTASRQAATIAAPGTFSPPDFIPDAAPDWHLQLTQPGVAIAGSHPFLDPSGYRADLIFQLADLQYGVPNLYDTLVSHYSISKATDALGKTYDYKVIYEHSAFAAFNADATHTYRYVKLPDTIGLSDSALNRHYRRAFITIPDLKPPFRENPVRVHAPPTTWGLTILETAQNVDNAVAFLQLLFGSQGVAIQTATGPAPITPPVVSREDFRHLPRALKPLVAAQGRDDD